MEDLRERVEELKKRGENIARFDSSSSNRNISFDSKISSRDLIQRLSTKNSQITMLKRKLALAENNRKVDQRTIDKLRSLSKDKSIINQLKKQIDLKKMELAQMKRSRHKYKDVAVEDIFNDQERKIRKLKHFIWQKDKKVVELTHKIGELGQNVALNAIDDNDQQKEIQRLKNVIRQKDKALNVMTIKFRESGELDQNLALSVVDIDGDNKVIDELSKEFLLVLGCLILMSLSILWFVSFSEFDANVIIVQVRKALEDFDGLSSLLPQKEPPPPSSFWSNWFGYFKTALILVVISIFASNPVYISAFLWNKASAFAEYCGIKAKSKKKMGRRRRRKRYDY